MVFLTHAAPPVERELIALMTLAVKRRDEPPTVLRPAARLLPTSQESMLRERIHLFTSDQEVIEESHVDERESVLQPPSYEFIRAGGFGDARGVIVCADDCCGVGLERSLDDLARVYAGPVNRPTKQLLDRQDVMARIEQDEYEHLVLKACHCDGQVITCCAR